MIYDVVVIGGGIHGVGVAQAAAARGYSVMLIEKQQLAYGTSSKSSKLIHGGLRYLESGQFNLVRECLYERQLLVRNAPDIVNLVPFYIPVYKETSRRPLTIRAGLTMYGALTGFHKSAKFNKIERKYWSDLDGLKINGLQRVFQYWDAKTDDALLTRAVMNSAQNLGAELLEHTSLVSGIREKDVWVLNTARDQEQIEIQASAVINASGPWVNDTLAKLGAGTLQREIDLVQGSHIVFDKAVNKGVYYLEAPRDKRAIFVMPWKKGMMIGTTETLFEGAADQVTPTEDEINYLIETYQHYFDDESINRENMQSAFAGLRVLPHAQGEAFSRPRDTVLVCDNKSHPSLLSIYGGKLTAYRATAEQVMTKLSKALPEREIQADTRQLKLHLPVMM